MIAQTDPSTLTALLGSIVVGGISARPSSSLLLDLSSTVPDTTIETFAVFSRGIV
jgi:hypothetical protein